jgi:glycosyltransferase involved in cell wall biosynthesis
MDAVILYSKLAPFHFDRLEVAGKLWEEHGARLTCIEVAAEQASYPWNRSTYAPSTFGYRTLFGDDYSALSYFELRRAIISTLDEVRPDVVVINGWGHRESLAALGWCCRNSVHRVLISDSQVIDKPRSAWKEALKKSFVTRCHAGFVGGTPHITYLASLGLPAEYSVVGCDVVNNALFAPVSNNGGGNGRGGKSDAIQVMSCLRFLNIKNIPTVLEALARVRVSCHWTLAGDGPERKNIQRLITKLGLQDRVSLPGLVSYDALPSMLSQADVYLQPSLSEPWGLAVNEALAAGLPAIVSRQCGCQEDLIRDGVNGFTFDAESPDNLIAVLEKMWTRRSEWTEMGNASSEIITPWSLDLFARNLWRSCELAIQRGHTADVGGSIVTRFYNLL